MKKHASQVGPEPVIKDELNTTDPRKRADFSDLVGNWAPDPVFDEILATQRQIDPDKWK